ncbi:sigma factor-like helix-turn-helix DNA-binding protein [Kitasatospora purpeofusca]|uniref:sigma factor-like helix-turn-helix DNA-binding protein n=1 Tax=Kitasatospora purpeofusca TaxID=67352 RepID=UPI0036D3163B
MAADDTVGRAGAVGEASGRPSTADGTGAFEAFARQAQLTGRSYVRRRSPDLDPSDIDDIVQGALVKVWGRWDRLPGPDDERTAMPYFFAVLRTTITDHFRALSRQQATVARSDPTYTEAKPDHRLDALEFEMTVKDVLDTVDPHLRKAILDLLGESLDVPAAHSAGDWNKGPVTARQRRDDLLRRFQSELRPVFEQAGLVGLPDDRPSRPAFDVKAALHANCSTCRPEIASRLVAAEAESAHEARQREWLEREIDRLPAREQQVARLAASGATPAQIAERLGISANNARVTLCHARKKLQAKLNVTPKRLGLLLKRPPLRHADIYVSCSSC